MKGAGALAGAAGAACRGAGLGVAGVDGLVGAAGLAGAFGIVCGAEVGRVAGVGADGFDVA